MEHTLYLMRHFPTEANDNEIFMGQQDLPAILPKHINSDYPVEWKIDVGKKVHIMCSPLLRTLQTSEYLITQFSKLEWTIEVIPTLSERCLGDFEGLPKSMLNTNDFYFYKHKLVLDNTPPNAEPIDIFIKRVLSIVSRVDDILLSQDVLIISHMQVLRTLIGYYRGFSLAEMKKNWYSIQINNGEIICVNNLLM